MPAGVFLLLTCSLPPKVAAPQRGRGLTQVDLGYSILFSTKRCARSSKWRPKQSVIRKQGWNQASFSGRPVTTFIVSRLTRMTWSTDDLFGAALAVGV